MLAVIPVPPGVSGVSSVDSSTFRDLVSDGTVGVIKCGQKSRVVNSLKANNKICSAQLLPVSQFTYVV